MSDDGLARGHVPEEDLFEYRLLRNARWSCHNTRGALHAVHELDDDMHARLREVEARLLTRMRKLRVVIEP